MAVEIFKTKDKGWGVRSLHDVKKGEFVCEYVGEVLTEGEAEKRATKYDNQRQSYLFDLLGENSMYTLDAKHYGNFSRYINHSCDANLSIYECYIDNSTEYLPIICMFASRDIPAFEELSINYNYSSDNPSTPKKGGANTKIICKCGKPNCKKILWC